MRRTVHRLALVAALLLLTALPLPRPTPVAAAGPFAYISNEADDTVSVIDTSTNAVVATIPVGDLPVGIAVNTAGTRVYVANQLGHTVSVIDTSTNTVGATIPLASIPAGVAVNSTGTRVYVALEFSSSVAVIDSSTNTVVASIPVRVEPIGVAVNPAGTRVYVANLSSTVSVIDTSINTVVATIPVGTSPSGVAVTPDGTRVYVTDQNSSTVAVLDATTNTVAAAIPMAGGSFGVAVNPTGTRVYVSVVPSDAVAVIDTSTNAVVATIGVGTAPEGVAVTPTGSRVYVANNIDDTVSVIDTGTDTVVATIHVGSGPAAFGQFIQPAQVTPSPPSLTFTDPGIRGQLRFTAFAASGVTGLTCTDTRSGLTLSPFVAGTTVTLTLTYSGTGWHLITCTATTTSDGTLSATTGLFVIGGTYAASQVPPPGLDFGATSGGCVARTLIIKDDGSQPFVLNSLGITGTNAAALSILSGGGPGLLQPGQGRVVRLQACAASGVVVRAALTFSGSLGTGGGSPAPTTIPLVANFLPDLTTSLTCVPASVPASGLPDNLSKCTLTVTNSGSAPAAIAAGTTVGQLTLTPIADLTTSINLADIPPGYSITGHDSGGSHIEAWIATSAATLAPGASVSFIMSVGYGVAATVQVVGTANPDGTITEATTANNTSQTTVTVTQPPP